MSRELTAAKRYAKALFEASRDNNSVNQVSEDLGSAVRLLQDNPELETLFKHPNVDTAAKTELLRKLFGGQLSDITVNTLALLVERGRSELIPVVYGQFIKIANAALGRAEAIVYSPKALTAEESTAVAARFSNLTGKNVIVTNILDPELLGGIKVRIGDTLYDGSLSGKLERLEKALQASQAL